MEDIVLRQYFHYPQNIQFLYEVISISILPANIGIVSASVGGDIPIPPPMPVGGDTLKFNSSQTNEEPINKKDDKPSCQSKDDYEVKVYPPGGVEVDAESKSDDDKRSRNQREAEKDSDPDLYFNYNETLKTIDGYYEFNEAKSKEWYSNFFKHGDFSSYLI